MWLCFTITIATCSYYSYFSLENDTHFTILYLTVLVYSSMSDWAVFPSEIFLCLKPTLFDLHPWILRGLLLSVKKIKIMVSNIGMLIAAVWQWWCFLLALNAAEELTVSQRDIGFTTFTWLLPSGYFEGFNISGIASLDSANSCEATVYGKTCVCLQPTGSFFTCVHRY